MVLRSESHEIIFNDELRQKYISEKGNYYVDIGVLDKERGLLGVYDKHVLIDEISMDVEECKKIFERRNIFKAELIKDGYSLIRFFDFHIHSSYSILDGMSTIKELVAAAEYAAALTDHGNMFGFYKFYKAMKNAGKKPVIGFEAYLDRYNPKVKSKSRAHVVILCMNEEGYKNAIKLTSLGYQKGKKTKKEVRPSFTYEDLYAHKEGLMVTSACIGGDIPKNIEEGYLDEAEKLMIEMKEHFGDNFYVEVQKHNIENEERVNLGLITLAKKHGLKVVAGVDSHYLKKEHKHHHEVLLANNRKTTMSNPNRWVFPGDGYYKKTSSEMVELFKDTPEFLDNTLEMLDKIEYEMPDTDYHLPKFDIPAPFKNEYEYLLSIVRKGMDEYGFSGLKEYEERLEFELKVIKDMGYSSYFLIVWDYIDYAKRNGILVGPGRGSACGSLVAYAMKITNVNPIKYGLLFERFLSVDRISMPDIDTDFQDDRREEVIDYVRNKYGDAAVSNIITYGTMKAKSASKDVNKIYDFPVSFGEKIAKLIPNKAKNIPDALEQSEELENLYNSNKDVKKILDTASVIEGLPKSIGKHACFDENTLIKTSTGYKKIIDIKVGDRVLTHKCRYQPVVDLIQTYTDEVYIIHVENLEPVRVTGNHPFYVRGNKCKKAPKWKNVNCLEEGVDYVAIPLTKSNFKKLHNSEALIDDNFIWKPISKISKVKQSQKMYNLTVLEDSSYVAGDMVVHNCGVIIAPDEITKFIPQVIIMDETDELDSSGKKIFKPVMVTQLDMTECEELGLLKMDFLGLTNLSIISAALVLINKKRKEQGLPPLTIDDIPINDPYAYRHIQRGFTTGVFQLESGGMTNLVKDTYSDIEKFIEQFESNRKVNEKGVGEFGEDFDILFERLIALISLYRPGPMDEIPNYLFNMKNPESVEYDIPELKDILENTYGIIVYQEQVMHIVRQLAGFSAGQSDMIRKAMGKKKKEIIEEYGEYFIYGSAKKDEELKREGKKPFNIKGCVANGIPEEKAIEIWDKMVKFAEYAFNKSHATGYSVIAIQTAWLSNYYPVEFMTALLNCNIAKKEKLEHYIAKAKRTGFNLFGPDVNKSQEMFSISYDENNSIRFGLRGVKGVGKSSKLIIGAREDGEFTSLTNFVERLSEYEKCEKKVLETLARCGAFESIEKNRKAIADSAQIIVDSLKKRKTKNVKGQISLFDMLSEDEELSEMGALKLIETQDYTKEEKLKYEKELISFYVSGHPLDKHKKLIDETEELNFLSDIRMVLDVSDVGVGEDDEYGEQVSSVESIEDVLVLGQIIESTDINTKKGEVMTTIELEDMTGQMKCVAFPKTRTAYRSKLIEGSIVVVKGRAVRDDYGIQIIIEDMSSPHTLSTSANASTIKYNCPYSKNGAERVRAINEFRRFKNTVESFEGNGDVEALFEIDGEVFEIGRIPHDINVIVGFRKVFGISNIELIN